MMVGGVNEAGGPLKAYSMLKPDSRLLSRCSFNPASGKNVEISSGRTFLSIYLHF